MKRLLPLLSFSLLIHALLPQGLVAQETYSLLPQWKPGQKVEQVSQTIMEISLPQPAQNTVTVHSTLTVDVGNEPNRKTVKVTTDRVQAQVALLGQPQQYDSEDPAKSPPLLQQLFGSIVGKDILLIHDQNDRLIEASSTAPEATPLGQGKGISGTQYAEAYRLSQALFHPEKPVALQEKWTLSQSMELPPLGAVTVEAVGKLDSIETKKGHRIAKITVEGTFKSADNAIQGALVVKPGSEFKGEAFFDLDNRLSLDETTLALLNCEIEGQEAQFKLTSTVKPVPQEPSNKSLGQP